MISDSTHSSYCCPYNDCSQYAYGIPSEMWLSNAAFKDYMVTNCPHCNQPIVILRTPFDLCGLFGNTVMTFDRFDIDFASKLEIYFKSYDGNLYQEYKKMKQYKN